MKFYFELKTQMRVKFWLFFVVVVLCQKIDLCAQISHSKNRKHFSVYVNLGRIPDELSQKRVVWCLQTDLGQLFLEIQTLSEVQALKVEVSRMYLSQMRNFIHESGSTSSVPMCLNGFLRRDLLSVFMLSGNPIDENLSSNQ